MNCPPHSRYNNPRHHSSPRKDSSGKYYNDVALLWSPSAMNVRHKLVRSELLSETTGADKAARIQAMPCKHRRAALIDEIRPVGLLAARNKSESPVQVHPEENSDMIGIVRIVSVRLEESQVTRPELCEIRRFAVDLQRQQ